MCRFQQRHLSSVRFSCLLVPLFYFHFILFSFSFVFLPIFSWIYRILFAGMQIKYCKMMIEKISMWIIVLYGWCRFSLFFFFSILVMFTNSLRYINQLNELCWCVLSLNVGIGRFLYFILTLTLTRYHFQIGFLSLFYILSVQCIPSVCCSASLFYFNRNFFLKKKGETVNWLTFSPLLS